MEKIARLQSRMLAGAAAAAAVVVMALTLGTSARELFWPTPPPSAPPSVRQFGFISVLTGEAVLIDPDGTRRRVRGTTEIAEGTGVEIPDDALADITVGESARLTLLGGTRVRMNRARVERDGKVNVDLDLEKGTLIASVEDPSGGTQVRVHSAGTTLTTEGAEFIARVGPAGLVLDVLHGTVRVDDPLKGIQIVRAGERYETRPEGSRITASTPEEVDELLRWAPHLQRRMIELLGPKDRPTEITRELHEKFLRKLIRQASDWWIDQKPLFCIVWTTDPVKIGELSLTRPLLKVFIEAVAVRHEVRKIEYDEKAFIFEWKIDPKVATVKVAFKAKVEAVETEKRALDAPPGPAALTCLISMELESIITFTFIEGHWRASDVQLNFKVLDAQGVEK